MAQQWVIQEKCADDEVEWDTWVIGIIDEGMFCEQMRTHDKKMAIRIKCVMEWFEEFELGVIISPVAVNRKINRQVRKKTTK